MADIDDSIPPTEGEATHVLAFLKANRRRTKDWFASILENRGIGSFKQDDKRPFNRNLLFNKNEAGSVTQIYLPSWLDEIKRCHLPLWSLADDDKEMGDMYEFITSFKHDWEDFFQALSARFPDSAANLLSDFEYAGLEMFGNLEASIISGSAKTPDAETDHDVFLNYLPEIKKLFVKENASVKTRQGRQPSTVKELIETLIKKDQAATKEKISKLAATFFNNLILSSELPISEDVDVRSYYKVLNQIIAKEIELLGRKMITQPGTFCRWQLAVPTAITLLFHEYEYGITDAEDDDPETFSETLSTGEVVYIKAYQQQDNVSCLIGELQKLIGTYLKTALKLSQSIRSDSVGMWKDALSNYNLANHAFSLNRNQEMIEKMSRSMLAAASRLSIDLSLTDNGMQTQGPAVNAIGENKADEIVSKIATKIDQSKGELKAHVSSETDRGIAASSGRDTTSPVKIGKGFPFITYCDPSAELLRMKVRLPSGELDEHPFKIKGKERWHYILQFVRANKSRITLKPHKKGKTIKLSLVFRNNKGYNHSQFHKFIRSTRGSKAQYWLEQTQVQQRTK